MGETYRYFLKQAAQAKPYYEKSLTYFDHPGAKRALEEYKK